MPFLNLFNNKYKSYIKNTILGVHESQLQRSSCDYSLYKLITKLKDVTDPRGKKSNPTIASNNELLPLLYYPSTHIEGNFMIYYKPISLN